MQLDNRVAIVSCTGYSSSIIYENVKTLWENLGTPDLQGKRILVKPNLVVDAYPNKAITTHPRLVHAVCKYILDNGGYPIVGDSPGLQKPGFRPKKSGITAVCEELGIPWVDFMKSPSVIINPEAKIQDRFTIAAEALTVDYIVNLPKLKTHQLMYMTGAVKNMFGLIPGLNKSPFHLKYPKREAFADMILDLYTAIPTEIHIMDAVIAMEGPGPSNGFPKRVGALLASKNGYALDLAALSLMHENPTQVPITAQSYRRGLLSTMDYTDLEYPLERPESLMPSDYIRIPHNSKNGFLSVIGSHIRRWFTSKPELPPAPQIDHISCRLCKACVEICPAQALSLSQDPETGQTRISVDENPCIRCYCCHEVCPANAIRI